MKIALVGCGAIGKVIAKAIVEGRAGDSALSGVYDIDKQKCTDLAGELDVHTFENIKDLLNSDTDLVIEAASQKAVFDIGLRVLEAGKDIMIMSVGAMVDDNLRESIFECAKKLNRKVYFPSGAICGLDGIKSASIAKIDKVILITRKNPMGLKDVKYLEDKGINVDGIRKETVVFEGPASIAAKEFKKNINVSACLSLAGIGPKNTIVKIIADPSVDRNIHRIEAQGEFGSLFTEVINVLSPDNPKTSYLAALSAVATLKKITNPFQVGT